MGSKTNIAILCTLLFSCSDEKPGRTYVCSGDGGKHLTVLSIGEAHYFIGGLYAADTIPDKYILNKSLIEYFEGIARFDKNTIILYSHYGSFDVYTADAKMTHKRIGVSEFEKLKKDTANYVYFYYPTYEVTHFPPCSPTNKCGCVPPCCL